MARFLFLLFITITLNSGSSFAQDRNSIWVFGDSAGIDFTNINNPVPITSSMDGRGSCASISDSLGVLQLYCYNKANINDTSTFILNGFDDIVQNGSDLNGAYEYNQVVIIPKPSHSDHYYVFHSGLYSTQGFYVSEVDISLNGGLGEVISRNDTLINNTRTGDCVQAIKHANGRDWWVVTKLSGPGNTHINRFYVFLVTPSGISNPMIQNFGGATDGDLQKLIFNNRGTRLMNINFIGLMTEFDFDRCTGIISNPVNIFPEQSSNYSRFFWEGVYSPNDSVFYTTTTWNNYPNDTSRLLQFNVFAADVPASCDTLFEGRTPFLFGAVRLAPDNKIYMSNFYNWGFPGYPYPDTVYNQFNMNLSVINSPDSIGTSCNFQPFSFYLGGKRSYAGLPNNPNYSLGAVVNSACDTVLDVKELPDESERAFLFPNPAQDEVTFSSNRTFGKCEKLIIYNCQGEELNVYDLSNVASTFTFKISAHHPGVYFLKHSYGNNILSQTKLVIIR